MKKIINLSIRLVLALIYLVGGWVFFKINYSDHAKVESLKNNGIEAKAVVKDLKMTESGVCPYLEFETPDNKKTYFVGFENSDVQVGDVVTVKYNPENAQEAALQADLDGYPGNFKKSVFGSALFCGICFVVAVFTLTSKRFKIQMK
ncbi:DUF3592 domain-containing protein [Flexithrix dorotheae]|uniref:DUF3592 domain-containing protein n=1 Tax=Flexithrix dorotheae TaxID=70993 RepID=UPI00036B0744|nr:DUF3592 domain-containing protein [Flexithrix dorotheae]